MEAGDRKRELGVATSVGESIGREGERIGGGDARRSLFRPSSLCGDSDRGSRYYQ